MAMTTNVPPQAYTRETLVKAIEWLQGQPPAVRERATSADLVVSHYMQARRRANAFETETPVSAEVFKSDLRHLAEDMRQFEAPPPPQHTPHRSPSFELPPELRVQPAPPRQQPQPQPRPPVIEEAAAVHWPVDPRTLAAAREIQQRLNLGSEVEALRLLVTFGAERARALFP